MVNFNPNKTEAMLFRYHQDQEYPILLFENVTVKFVSEHKHLGLTFSENMKWKCHIDSILTSASRMIGIMRKLKYTEGNKFSNF